ncbi:MAG: N-acetyl-alpha-D-glucosaminyl L-malate synthase BshA [Candidatus Latescibacteria bacterium]|jgi:L-malate glycosyltransferase|nr:N-acetyl-alpha-D-glucosaminyl L-malate synthase BshA [Candidatus Latescibacterota bacterium]
MNIGITCYPTYGGSGTVATELGRNLAGRGHNIHFITTALPYRLTDFVENVYYHEVQVFNYPLFDYTPYSLSLASKMAQVAIREDLDLLHVHYAVPHATSAYLAKKIIEKRKRIPIITTLHGTDITLVGNDPSYFDITKFSIEESDAVTAVSQYLKNQTIYRFMVDNEIEVIPNFVDTEKFSPRTSEARKCLAEPDEKVIMHISNFRPVKRIPDIIDVFEEVSRRIKARLILIGSGPEKEHSRALVEEKGLSDRVHYLGVQNDVSQSIACADVYLLLSEHESFGLTALEAMSCGVPVIGTSGSGMDEFLGDSEAGLLFEVGEIQGMIDGCVSILSNPDLASKMGKKGRERVLQLYSEERIIGLYENLYMRAIEQSE